MTVFVCAGCDAVLSSQLAQVALPVHAHQKWGHQLLPVLMEPGTYAVDSEPSGPPWRPWGEIGEDDAATRGVFAPESLSFGPPGAIVIAPGDARGTVLIPDRCGGYCCGLDGRDGPNLACAQCGQPVATLIDDCSLWQAVWFAPNAVRALRDNQPTGGTTGWEWQKGQAVPPVAPDGSWNPQWAAAVGAGLAHLLAASEGTPAALPKGPITDTFGHALNALLPTGAPAKTVALAGPGLPARGSMRRILLVPQHPQTGERWLASTYRQDRAHARCCMEATGLSWRTAPAARDRWTPRRCPTRRSASAASVGAAAARLGRVPPHAGTDPRGPGTVAAQDLRPGERTPVRPPVLTGAENPVPGAEQGPGEAGVGVGMDEGRQEEWVCNGGVAACRRTSGRRLLRRDNRRREIELLYAA